MFKEFQSGKVRNFQVEVAVNNKPVTVNITDNSANAWMPISADNQSSVNMNINIETGKQLMSITNIESTEAANVSVTELVDAMNAVIAEFKTILIA